MTEALIDPKIGKPGSSPGFRFSIVSEMVSLQVVAQQKSRVRRPAFL
jgi:hypothetical protein